MSGGIVVVVLRCRIFATTYGYDYRKYYYSNYCHFHDNPIIFLTALATETSITYGLGLGADDYLTKPFRITELRARINAHLRRENREHHITLNIGAFRFDLAQKVLYFHDQLVILTKGEYEICEYLGQNKQCIYSREQIYEAVFGYDAGGDSQSIATHIKNIRQK